MNMTALSAGVRSVRLLQYRNYDCPRLGPRVCHFPLLSDTARLSPKSGSDTFVGNTRTNHDLEAVSHPHPTSSSFLPSNHRTHSHPSANKLLALILMSHTHPTAASSSSSPPASFELLINKALDTYKERTRKDLRDHPLAKQLQDCQSPDAVLVVLKQQLDQSQSTDERWTKWLDPTIHVLLTFSQAVGTVGLV